MKTKGEVVRKIILGLEEPSRYADVVDSFEEKTGIEVSKGRVKQIALEMSEEGKIEIEHKVNEKGNAVSFVIPTEGESDEVSS